MEWYVDKLKHKHRQMDIRDDVMTAMRLAELPDDVIRTVTDSLAGACDKADESIQKWKEFAASLSSICALQQLD